MRSISSRERRAAAHQVIRLLAGLGHGFEGLVLAQQLRLAQQRVQLAAAIALRAAGIGAEDHRADELAIVLREGVEQRGEGVAVDVGVVVDDPEVGHRQVVQCPAQPVVVATGVAVVLRVGEHGDVVPRLGFQPLVERHDGAVLGIVVDDHHMVESRAMSEQALNATDGFSSCLVVEDKRDVHG